MAVDTDYGAVSDRISNAAATYSMKDPRLSAGMDVATAAMGLAPFSKMGLNSQEEIKAIVMMVLNQMGIAPGSQDFIGMHRAVMQAGANGYRVSNGTMGSYAAPGAGNISIAAATQIARGVTQNLSGFQRDGYGIRGAFDSGNVNGLSQTTAIQIAAQQMANRGFKEGDMEMLDFANGEDSVMEGTGILRHASGNKMRDRLNALTDKGGKYEGRRYSEEFQEMYRQADILAQREKYVERHSEIFGGQLDLTNKKHREAIEKFYRGEVKDEKDKLRDTNGKSMTLSEADRLGIEALDKGEGKSLLVSNQLTSEISKGVKKASENVAELSKIFKTDDLNQLQQIADSLGMASISEADKVKEVKDSIFRAKKIAVMTGRSVKEVMEEQQGIVASFQAQGGTISNTSVAGIQERTGNPGTSSGWRSNEEKTAAAERTEADAQRYLTQVAVMQKMLRDGTLSGKQAERAQEIISRIKDAERNPISRDELDKLIGQADDITHSSMNRRDADNVEFQRKAWEESDISAGNTIIKSATKENYGKEYWYRAASTFDPNKKQFSDAFAQEMYERNGGNYKRSLDMGASMMQNMQKLFGGGQDGVRDQLFNAMKIDNKEERDAAIKKVRDELANRGASEEQLAQFDSLSQSIGSLSKEARTDFMKYVDSQAANNATFAQDSGVDKELKNREAANKIAIESLNEDVVRRNGNGTSSFETAMNAAILNGEDMTARQALAMYIGEANGSGDVQIGDVGVFDKNGEAVYETDKDGKMVKDENGRPVFKKTMATIRNAGALDTNDLAKNGIKADSAFGKAMLDRIQEQYTATHDGQGMSKEELKALRERMSKVENVNDVQNLLSEYGVIMNQSANGTVRLTTEHDAEALRRTRSLTDEKMGLKGARKTAETIFGTNNTFEASKTVSKDGKKTLAKYQIGGDDTKAIYVDANGDIVDEKGNKPEDSETDEVAKMMWENTTAEWRGNDDGASALEALKRTDPVQAKILERGKMAHAESLYQNAIKNNSDLEDAFEDDKHLRGKMAEARNSGDANAVLDLLVEANGGKALQTSEEKSERNKLLGTVLRARELATKEEAGGPGKRRYNNNEYLLQLRKMGYITEGKDGFIKWTQKAEDELGDKIAKKGSNFSEGTEDDVALEQMLGGKDSASVNALKNSVTKADQEKAKEEMELRNQKRAQMCIAQNTQIIADNLYALLADQKIADRKKGVS